MNDPDSPVAPQPPDVLETPAALQVDVDRLRGQGLAMASVEAELPMAWLQQALAATDARVAQAGQISCQLTLQPDGLVLLRGRLLLNIDVPCARCLEPAPVDGSTDICVTYEVGHGAEAGRRPGPADDGDDGVELEGGDLERYLYDGTCLELGPMVAEQVALAYPMRALCSRGEACRGLCSGCGADLNGLPGGVTMCANCARPLDGGFSLDSEGDGGESDEDPDDWRRALRKLRDN